MKIALKKPTNETLKGAQILLEQLGITYTEGYTKNVDIYITDKKEKKTCQIIIVPKECAYIAKASTLQVFNKQFADNFEWDKHREEFLRVLQNTAEKIQKPLIRVYYFPDIKYKNSLSFSGDIDHLFQWKIITQKQGKIKKILTKLLPNKIMYNYNMLTAPKNYNEKYNEMIEDKLAQWFWKIGTKITLSKYFTPFTLTQKNTFFVRPEKYQKEENGKLPPEGTGRKNYFAQKQQNKDLELHFGFTIGPYNRRQVNSPYQTTKITKEVLKDQYNELTKQIGKIHGTRIHHPYLFTPKIFEYLNELDILYDSSVFSFSKAMGFDSKFTPNGTTLPYWPVLKKKAKYVELPVTYYEVTESPKKLHHASIIVSQHPDNTQTYFIKKLLKEYKDAWKPSLKELSGWWKKRREIKITTNSCKHAPTSFGIILYPKNAKVEIQGYKKIKSYTKGNTKYTQLKKDN